MILFCMDGLYPGYVVGVLVWHLFGEPGVSMACRWFVGGVCVFLCAESVVGAF